MRFLLAVLLLASACELNPGSADGKVTSTTDDVDESTDTDDVVVEATDSGPTTTDQTDPPTPASGCGWAAGTWTLTDCSTPSGVDIAFVTQGCIVQINSAAPLLVGAYGVVQDGGMVLVLPATNTTCHAFYDGSVLTGACSAAGGGTPCWFYATRE